MIKGKIRIITVAVILVAVSMFHGCAALDTDMKVTSDGKMRFSYTLTVDMSSADEPEQSSVIEYVTAVADYWQSCGMKTRISGADTFSDEHTVMLEAYITQSCSSAGEAFTSLCNTITDSRISPFSEVNYACDAGNFRDEYYLKLTCDLSDGFYDMDEITYPSTVMKKLVHIRDNSTLNVTVTLPGEDNSDDKWGTDDSGYCVYSFSVLPGEECTYEMYTVVTHTDMISEYEEGLDKLKLMKALSVGAIIIAGLLIITAITVLIVAAERKKNPKPVKPKEFEVREIRNIR